MDTPAVHLPVRPYPVYPLRFCSGPFEPLGGFFQGIAILRPPNMRIRGGLPLVPIALFATQKAGMRFPAHAGRSFVFRRACTRRADVSCAGVPRGLRSRDSPALRLFRARCPASPQKRRGPKQGRAVSSWFQPPCYLPQRFCMSLRSRAFALRSGPIEWSWLRQ